MKKESVKDFIPTENFKAIKECGQITSDGRVNLNWSSIQTKLIQDVGRFTEQYASDIILDINSIQAKIDGMEEFEELIGIRGSGVDHTAFVLSRYQYQEVFSGYNSLIYRKLYKVTGGATSRHGFPEYVVTLQEMQK